jgi:hypothetical protein
MDDTGEKKGLTDKAGRAGREALDELGQVVDEIVEEAPGLWEKTKRAAGGAAAEVQEKGPGLWAHVKSVAADTAAAFDKGLSGDEEDDETTGTKKADEPGLEAGEADDGVR